MTPGLKALTTPEELLEAEAVGQFKAPSHDPACTKSHLVLVYAWRQFDKVFWHVVRHAPCPRNPAFRFAQSTLSMDGLRDWRLL